MDTTSGTVTVWKSGRLAPQGATQRFEFDREHALICGLLALSTLVFAMFVVVLERDVDSGAMQHARAVAQAQCEAEQPARLRGRCIAMLSADGVVLQAPVAAPHTPGVEQEKEARAATLALLAAR
jgi:hypothetical protein